MISKQKFSSLFRYQQVERCNVYLQGHPEDLKVVLAPSEKNTIELLLLFVCLFKSFCPVLLLKYAKKKKVINNFQALCPTALVK